MRPARLTGVSGGPTLSAAPLLPYFRVVSVHESQLYSNPTRHTVSPSTSCLPVLLSRSLYRKFQCTVLSTKLFTSFSHLFSRSLTMARSESARSTHVWCLPLSSTPWTSVWTDAPRHIRSHADLPPPSSLARELERALASTSVRASAHRKTHPFLLHPTLMKGTFHSFIILHRTGQVTVFGS